MAITLGDGGSSDSPCCEYAHRLVCFWFNGPPPAGKECVSHRCHNKDVLESITLGVGICLGQLPSG